MRDWIRWVGDWLYAFFIGFKRDTWDDDTPPGPADGSQASKKSPATE